jgi:glycosyltransferase involved in cell wall biosynthesis
MSGTSGRRRRISALITTGNEERNIGDCIESLQWCDEIVVVDSFSTDKTTEIVRSFPGVKLLQRTYFGAASQKNWGIDQTSHPWVFILDADERCTPELQTEIENLLSAEPEHEAYTIRRQVYFMDRVIRFSGWRHDRVVRLFKRGAVRYERKRVHPKAIVRGTAPMLRSPMLHLMIESFEQYLPRIVTYGFWGAAQRWRAGKRAGPFEVFGRPFWRFIRMYLIQLGFLDGMAGLVFCMLQSFGAYLKYAILWEWRENAARGRPPNLPDFDEDEEVWRGPDADDV